MSLWALQDGGLHLVSRRISHHPSAFLTLLTALFKEAREKVLQILMMDSLRRKLACGNSVNRNRTKMTINNRVVRSVLLFLLDLWCRCVDRRRILVAVGVRAIKPLFWLAVTRKLLELVWTATGLLSAPLGDGLVALVALVACGGVLFPVITATAHYWIRNHNYFQYK